MSLETHEVDVKVELLREQLDQAMVEMSERSRRERFVASDALNMARDCQDKLEIMHRHVAAQVEMLEQGLRNTM